MNNFQLNGKVAPGFESVKALFEQQMSRMAEQHAQLCVYHRGEKVVDLWASVGNSEGFSADAKTTIFSSGKSMEAIAIGMLVSQGLIDYDAKITQYWPEFGVNGKQNITVADVMRHESGLANFDEPLDAENLFTENIKRNAVGEIIEQHPPRYPVHGKREYHALTRGWIVNELFRRVEPTGRTLGEFIRDEVSQPLGADIVIGASDQDIQKRFPVKPLGFMYQLLQTFVPRFMGRKVLFNTIQLWRRLAPIFLAQLKNPQAKAARPFTKMRGIDYFNTDEYSKGETSSANTLASARGLAKAAAMMSAGGSLNGKQYLSEAAWQAVHAKPAPAPMISAIVTRFTQGGVDQFLPCGPESTLLQRALNEGREGFYGWMGFGGSIFQWHPELDIGFAFVPTALHYLDLVNERGKCFQAEVLHCVERLPSPAS
jgi:CubicO group peptidase (beta-lactamase class C family)